jgi:hypothetical protein
MPLPDMALVMSPYSTLLRRKLQHTPIRTAVAVALQHNDYVQTILPAIKHSS